MGSRGEKLGAWRMGAVYSIFGQDGVLALLLGLVRPCYIQRDMFLVVSQHQYLAAAFGWKQALVVGRVLEEAGHVVRADPMAATGSIKQETYFILL